MACRIRNFILISLSVCVASSFAGESALTGDDSPAMELGGNVLLDYKSDVADFESPDFGIGQVELGAKFNVSQLVVASVLIKAERSLDSLWIDQALVAYTPAGTPLEFLFGQQTFNHGLLTTRLISDPTIYDTVDFRAPGLILNGATELLSGGVGLTVLSGPEDPLGLTPPEKLYTSVVNCDLILPDESITRISAKINKETIDIDLAGNVNLGSYAFDAEFFAMLKTPDTLKPMGFYLGVFNQVTERLGLGVRMDGYSIDGFDKLGMRFAGGGVFDIKDGIFFALELAHDVPYKDEFGNNEPVTTIAFEFGLERTISLPGFQRKNLSRE